MSGNPSRHVAVEDVDEDIPTTGPRALDHDEATLLEEIYPNVKLRTSLEYIHLCDAGRLVRRQQQYSQKLQIIFSCTLPCSRARSEPVRHTSYCPPEPVN